MMRQLKAGRQAGRREERGEKGERLPQDGLLTWGATLIGWHVILFMQCALSTPDNWVAKLERRARRVKREECEERAEQEEEQEYNELAMSSLAHTRQ